ncbi:hypothetical protein [Lactococcus termiticola]|uniref:hypothetical protein n=1 Tax=Lactococcus termiticola TaxID=2169526 RepID=UPI000F650A79|nr:hypothetical protein [Lactococcus termiticola]
MKLYIAGCPASGKSYLSHQLSQRSGIAAYDCDAILYTAADTFTGNRKRTANEFEPLFNQILTDKDWIIEGVPRKKFSRALEEADYILILDFPKTKLYFRALKRYIKQKLKLETSGYKPSLKMLFQMFKWIYQYDVQVEFPEKQIIIKNKKQLLEFINNF